MGTVVRGVAFATLCIAGVAGVLVAHDMGRSSLGAAGGLLAALVALMLVGALALIAGVAWLTRPPSSPVDEREGRGERLRAGVRGR